MLERDFQASLIARLKEEFPGCIVLKNDPNYIQGFPDLLILYKFYWAALEVKASANAHIRPNQVYYMSTLNNMSYASFVYPENVDSVMVDLHELFEGD